MLATDGFWECQRQPRARLGGKEVGKTMLVLGLQGSPRIEGNTGILLSKFLDESERLGARTLQVSVALEKISPCLECGTCEKEGFCPIDDDMQRMYSLLWQADIVVMATPVFFYGPTAQMKALIDRSQALWARRYVHKLVDPGRKWRRGFLLSLGATKGRNLFEGVNLTAKYFFDAAGASFDGNLSYREIESAGEIRMHATALSEARESATNLVGPFLRRRKILFVCTHNTCRSQMAGAFARHFGGDKLEAQSAGSAPAEHVDPVMVEAMREKGLDMAYSTTMSIEVATQRMKPDLMISMGCEEACPQVPGVPIEDWGLPDPSGKPIDFMRQVRDDIEKRIQVLVG
jgi:protein-tyrosine-phosphatase